MLRFRMAWMILLSLALPSAMGAAQSAPKTTSGDLASGSWRFIVSGDSRNCGDVVMPAIAAQSRQYKPAFYWHLGDLRAIYAIDEDMAAAARTAGLELKCEGYQRRAWSDFVEDQIAPFGETPFYVGIGNHEVIPPKNEDLFKSQFHDFLDLPVLRAQRMIDNEPSQPEPYYHWIQNGVDFIYLDNAYNFFSEEEVTWLFRRLSDAAYDANIRSLVVGMHEALPDSLADDHGMGGSDDPRGAKTGRMVYQALWNFREKTKKPVYFLASHSHLFLPNIFETDGLKAGGKKPLPGWIAGTAGAERSKKPEGTQPLPGLILDTYGYLLATVAADGTMEVEFKAVTPDDIPQPVKQRYPADFIPWCFASNSRNVPKDPRYLSERCPLPEVDGGAPQKR